MEKEYIFSGYCRQLDAARMVEVVTEDGLVTELDCAYPGCCHAAACPIAQRIRELEHPREMD